MSDPSQGHTIYNRNGAVVRARPLDDDVMEITLDFPTAQRSHAIFYRVASLYLAFVERHPIDFEVSSYVLQSVVVPRSQLDHDAERALADAVAATQEHKGLVFRLAKEEFYDDRVPVETNTSEALVAYKKIDFVGARFGQALSAALGRKSDGTTPPPS